MRVGLVLLFVLTLCLGLQAEVIFLQNGDRIEGKILEWREESVVVQTKGGVTLIILLDEIREIRKAKSVRDIFEEKRRTLSPRDVEGFFRLGEWCRQQGLEKESRECFQYVLKLDPDHPGARRALGYRYYKGKWMSEKEYMKARGYVFYGGRWMTKEEYQKRRQKLIFHRGRWISRQEFERLRRQSSQVRSSRPLQLSQELQKLLRQTRSKDKKKRIAAYEALCQRGDEALAALKEELKKRKARLLQSIERLLRARKKALYKLIFQELQKRRQQARNFIMDPIKYPEKDHGRSAQPTVDQLVEAVRQVYERPFSSFVAQLPLFANKLRQLRELLEETNRYAKGVENYDYEVEKLDKVAEKLFPKIAFVPPGSEAALQYNASKKGQLDPEEWNCIDWTNRYRMMMGLRPLRIDLPLVRAARKHSEDMRRRNYFSHVTPEGVTPAQRCAAEGASYFSGENIARGSATGRGAFLSWYNSSGHHRNILGRHYSIGVGRSGTLWTQLFGAGGGR